MKTITNTNNDSKASRPTILPPFFGTILVQVLKFVLPEDVARVSMVCKTWRDELMQPQPNATSNKEHAPPSGVVINSTAVWKQAVINCNPNVIQTIIEATSTTTNDNSDDKNDEERVAAQPPAEIDFLALAKGALCRKRQKPKLPEPTFRIQDLMIVLELKQEKIIIDNETGEEKKSVVSLGTFVQNGSEAMLQENFCGKVDFDLEGSEILVEGQNHLCLDTYNGNTLLWEKAKTESAQSTKVDVFRVGRSFVTAAVTLVRRDDWSSFSLVDEMKIGGFWKLHLHQ